MKGTQDIALLEPAERMRMSALYVASFRRLEAVFVHGQLGSIDPELKDGFELSMMALIQTEFGRDWWADAKRTFYPPFVEHIDERLATGEVPERHPSIAVQIRE